jgi:competence protein ComFC
MNGFVRLIRGCGDALFPQYCLLCGKPLFGERTEGVAVCGSCGLELVPPKTQRCSVCSLPLTSEQGICLQCRGAALPFERNLSVFVYHGAVRELIYQYKFRNHRRIGLLLAAVLYRAWAENFSGVPAVPVPFRPSTKRRRGWDHIDVVARTLSRRHGVPVARLLGRREGSSQKSLNREARLANIQGSFYILRTVTSVPRSVVLIDDVFTTGATATECSRTLLEAGVKHVAVLTVAVD